MIAPDRRSPRRQRQVKHLIECGDRAVMEALLAAAKGKQTLDQILAEFERLDPWILEALGGDVLPIDQVTVFKGGRR